MLSSFNSLWPSDTHHKTWSTLVQVMACHLFIATLLTEFNVDSQDPWEQASVKIK